MLRSFAVAFALVAPALLARSFAQEAPLHRGTVVRFATIEEAAALLGRKDAFTRELSRFDLQARLKTRENAAVSDFLAFAARQAEPWTEEEVERLSARLEAVRKRLAPFPPLFPETILLIKTTGEEEGGAAYCRQNAIVLPRRMIQRDDAALERLLTHELFHLLSRQDPQRRDRLYAVVGFRPCGEIELPPSLRDRKITNPDAPRLDHYIELRTEQGPTPATPLLLAAVENYDPSSNKTFFQLMQFRLLQLARDGAAWRAARDETGRPILLDPEETPSYHEQIGRNTGYIIHPEEVLAENFVHLVLGAESLPTPRIVEELRAALIEVEPGDSSSR